MYMSKVVINNYAMIDIANWAISFLEVPIDETIKDNFFNIEDTLDVKKILVKTLVKETLTSIIGIMSIYSINNLNIIMPAIMTKCLSVSTDDLPLNTSQYMDFLSRLVDSIDELAYCTHCSELFIKVTDYTTCIDCHRHLNKEKPLTVVIPTEAIQVIR